MKKKICGVAIEGGGSFGALTAGRLEALNKDFQMGSGVSTGALMIVLVLLKMFGGLRVAYTSLTTNDITEVSAFNKKGHLSATNFAWRVLRKKVTLGESHNLRELIDRFIPNILLSRLKSEGKTAIVSAYSISRSQITHFSSDDFRANYSDFKDFIWASANAGPFMSILKKEVPGSNLVEEWTDGGITDGHTAGELFARGCTEVDLFVHRTKPHEIFKGETKDIFHYIMRVFDALFGEIKKDDLIIARYMAEKSKGILRVHYLPHKLASNSLVFDKKLMLDWYELGKKIAGDPKFMDVFDYSE